MDNSILGLFIYVDNLLAATQRLKGDGYEVTVLSPIPVVHEMDAVFGEKKNPLKYFTLIGALIGFCAGTFIALSTAMLYPLPRGGRAILSFTPTAIISYEMTILLGVLGTMFGFFCIARLPSLWGQYVPYFKAKVDAPEIASDSFGLLVDDVADGDYERIENILRECGAREVRKVDED